MNLPDILSTSPRYFTITLSITISTTLLLYLNFSFCTNFFTAYPLAFFYHAFFYRRNPVLQVTIIINEWMNERREWMKSHGWEDNIRTLLQYILTCERWAQTSAYKGATDSRSQSIYELTVPTQPMMWMMWCVKVHSHVLPIKTVEPVVKARVTNISFLLTISIDIQEKIHDN